MQRKGLKTREQLARYTLKQLGIQEFSAKELSVLLASFGMIAAQEHAVCVNHVRQCGEKFMANPHAFPYNEPALTAQVLAESLAVDLK